MDWSSFWSAVIGGVLVIAGHLVVHTLNRRASASDKKEEAEQRIASLALEVVNWFQIDTQLVIAAAGGAMPPTKEGHPVYALAALIRKARPDKKETAAKLLELFQKYYQESRILLPQAPANQVPAITNSIPQTANEIMAVLNEIVAAVCD
jgi:hypothetical protein